MARSHEWQVDLSKARVLLVNDDGLEAPRIEAA